MMAKSYALGRIPQFYSKICFAENDKGLGFFPSIAIPPLPLRTKVLLLSGSLTTTSFENLQAITPLVSNVITLLWGILSMLRNCIKSDSFFSFDKRSVK